MSQSEAGRLDDSELDSACRPSEPSNELIEADYSLILTAGGL